MTGKSLDSEEVEEVSVVLTSGELLGEEIKLEEVDAVLERELLDSRTELEDVTAVLKSDELLDSTIRLEEDVELLRIGDELEPPFERSA